VGGERKERMRRGNGEKWGRWGERKKRVERKGVRVSEGGLR
jgi:hypothetical protein